MLLTIVAVLLILWPLGFSFARGRRSDSRAAGRCRGDGSD
jgi:hypothetical protein